MEDINYNLLSFKFRASGMSYEKLAQKTQICLDTLHNVMYGITKPSYQVAYRLAKALLTDKEEIIEVFFPNIVFEEEITYE